MKIVMRSLTRRGGFHASARTVAISLAGALFVMQCALPVAWMLGASFIDSDGGLTVRNYGRLFAESRQRQLMLNSALLGAGASLLAPLIGAPLGLLGLIAGGKVREGASDA
jgi:ABC-type spermidine/putrescine transport system permease subunit II